jgi:hypothetical protein
MQPSTLKLLALAAGVFFILIWLYIVAENKRNASKAAFVPEDYFSLMEGFNAKGKAAAKGKAPAGKAPAAGGKAAGGKAAGGKGAAGKDGKTKAVKGGGKPPGKSMKNTAKKPKPNKKKGTKPASKKAPRAAKAAAVVAAAAAGAAVADISADSGAYTALTQKKEDCGRDVSIQEINILEERLEKANMAKDSSELNLRATKLYLEEQVKQNMDLTNKIGAMQKKAAAKEAKCMGLDAEILKFKKQTEMAKIDKKAADEQIKNIKDQLQAVQKNEPLAKKLQLQMDQVNKQKVDIEKRLFTSGGKLTDATREQLEAMQELKIVKKDIESDRLRKSAVERDLIEMTNKAEAERLAKETAENTVKQMQERLEIRDKSRRSLMQDVRKLKIQYEDVEKREQKNRLAVEEMKKKKAQCTMLETEKVTNAAKIQQLKDTTAEQKARIADLKYTVERLKKAI